MAIDAVIPNHHTKVERTSNFKNFKMNSIKFAYPYFLHFLWGIPFLCLFYIFVFRQKRKAYERFTPSQMFRRLARHVSLRRQKLKAVILILAYLFLVIGIARPQIGTKVEKVKRHGLDIFIALDTSLSMKAEDVKPNRLERATNAIMNFIGQMEGDRVGLILFSGTSFVQCPLTLDYDAIELFLDVVDSDTIPQAGTAIGKAINQAVEAFSNTEPKYKVMVIFSDGENHEKGLIESVRSAAAASSTAEAGIRIYTVGVGKTEGTPIPLYNRDGKFIGYKKDQFNQPVLSRLEEDTLRKIAKITNGRYYLVSSARKQLYSDISELESRELEERQFTQYEEKFHYFITIALILLIAELMLSDGRFDRAQ